MLRPTESTPLVRLTHLRKEFRGRGGAPGLTAVDDVGFDIYPGETVGLVGESGSGKSTLARMLVGLVQPTSGKMMFDGRELSLLSKGGWRSFRRYIQIVFQDPASSLNPRMTVGQTLGRPLSLYGLASGQQLRRRVTELLEIVGLRPEHAHRYPHQLSGGQQQRICIARALTLEPKFAILDEPTSALDVSVQAQILSLLRRLQRDLGITLLFISHDLSVIQYMSDRVVVLYRGQVMETGDTPSVIRNPRHPYTRLLLSSIPRFYGNAFPSPPSVQTVTSEHPAGCPFYSRCPHRLDVCKIERPKLGPIDAVTQIACFNPPEPVTS